MAINKTLEREILMMDRIMEKQASRVWEIERALLNVFDHYKKKPKWSLLQSMFALCYRLGWERRTYSFYESEAMTLRETSTKERKLRIKA